MLSRKSNRWSLRQLLPILGFFIVFWSQICSAAIDAFNFDSETERLRYQGLVQELRCPKCQNQNLADSNSEIAIDLRHEVARMVAESKTDTQIKQYMVDRYGDFVLYDPPVQENTMVLWWGPAVMLLLGAAIFIIILVRRRGAIDSDDEDNEASSLNDNND